MILTSPPTNEQIRLFRAEQSELDFTYRSTGAVGATAGAPPEGFTLDHYRRQLGYGAATYQRARAAIRGWRMFSFDWVSLRENTTPIHAGETVAILAKVVGLYWLNAARIVYVLDETGDVERFGFAYGTLPEHAECGEERFSVEFHHRDESVWYDLLAFSRPYQWPAKLAYPLTRLYQKRFARDSQAAMQRACAEPAHPTPR